MEGHSECVRYLVQQLLAAKHRGQLVPCPTSNTAHPVLDVTNNLGEIPRVLAERFLKYDTVKTIDRLLEQFIEPPDDDGMSHANAPRLGPHWYVREDG